MDERLQKIVFEKLVADGSIKESWSTLVIAACIGSEELSATLEGKAVSGAGTEVPPEPPEPPGAYLSSITVQGFRGIGPEATLELSPGPGLSLVVGRNGSGKSSFAEALELLFTGDNKRWAGRVKVWKEGWRNLHHSDPALIEADLAVEGQGFVRVIHEWKSTDEVDDGETIVQPHGQKKTTLADMGWQQAIQTYRPFLSYNELGSMLDEGPSKLYDALSKVLGLEDLVSAQKMLSDERMRRKKANDAAKAESELLADQARTLGGQQGDSRFTALLEALQKKPWDIASIQSLLEGTDQGEAASEIDILRRAIAIDIPSVEEVDDVLEVLRSAAKEQAQLKGSEAERARRIVLLLEQSLSFHAAHGDTDCPVCGNTAALSSSWRTRTEKELEDLRQQAAQAEAAVRFTQQARSRASNLALPPPPLLNSLAGVGIDAQPLTAAWSEWHGSVQVEALDELAGRLDAAYSKLKPAFDQAHKEALEEFKRREDAWRPVAKRVTAWVEPAQKAQAGMERVKDIKAAENWLKNASEDVRNERFAPIAARSMELWERLRQQSNVELGQIALAGARTSRKVALEVTVDGEGGAALSVMSQGELNALALSLFPPRATLPESPFRFVVIDDPVQSMDPSRVDGLARALEEVASQRQVVVFTHDERLPDAVRHLQIEAKVISVTRRPNSVVELRAGAHPVKMYIDDALAVASTKEMPDDVRRRVVPGFCRHAVEAAFMEIVRTRKLSKGEAHADVEDALKNLNKLTSLAALALFDDPTRGADVMRRLNQWGNWAGDTFKACNQGAHAKYVGDLFKMAQDTEQLCKKVLSTI